jgi:gliding motility-associated-like protein
LSGETINSISWNFNDPNSGVNNTSSLVNPNHVFTSAGSYNVSATVNANCGSFILNYQIDIINCLIQTPCFANIMVNDSCLSQAVAFQINTTSPVNVVSWNFGDITNINGDTSTLINPSHLYQSSGSYLVTAVVDLACGVETISKAVTIINCDSLYQDCKLVIPTCFTPNDDNINDFYSPLSNCPYNDYEFSIYNRWGQLIYNTKNPSDKWDGKLSGSKSSLDVYVYYVKYQFPLQDIMYRVGSVTLLR